MCRRSLVGNSLSQSDGIKCGSAAWFFPGVLPRVSSCLWVGHQWAVPLCRGAVHRLDRVKGGPWPGCVAPLPLTRPSRWVCWGCGGGAYRSHCLPGEGLGQRLTALQCRTRPWVIIRAVITRGWGRGCGEGLTPCSSRRSRRVPAWGQTAPVPPFGARMWGLLHFTTCRGIL